MSTTTVQTMVLSPQKSHISPYNSSKYSALQYQHRGILGTGRSSIVEEVVHTPTLSVYARKTFKVPPGQRSKVLQELEQECLIMHRLEDHRHMVQIVDSCCTGDALTLILEPVADGGTLKQFLSNYRNTKDVSLKTLMEGVIKKAYGCLSSALEFIHSREIRHRDIKPENILFHASRPLFADFGVSRDYSSLECADTTGKPDFFTPRYCAPEVKWWEKRTYRSDVFSLGCVFLVMYSTVTPNAVIEDMVHRGEKPFWDVLEIVRREVEGWWNKGERGVVECLEGMLREEEKKRFDAGDAVEILKRQGDACFCQDCWDEILTARQPPRVDSFSTLSRATTLCGKDTGVEFTKGFVTEMTVEVVDEEMCREPPDYAKDCATYSPISTTLDCQPCQTIVSVDEKTLKTYRRRDSMISASDGVMSTVSQSSSKDTEDAEEVEPSPQTTTQTVTKIISKPPKYGIQQHMIIQALQTTCHATSTSTERILHKDTTYNFTLPRLPFGIQVRHIKPYGPLIPSLRTFPIVPGFDFEWDLVKDGSVSDFQRAVAEGKVHPYVHDSSGQNLLYLSMRHNRLDLAAHLHNTYNLPPTPSHNSHTLFDISLRRAHSLPPATTIASLQFLLSTLSLPPDFTSPAFAKKSQYFLWHEEVMHWLSTHASTFNINMSELEALYFRMCLRWSSLYIDRDPIRAEALIRRYLTPKLVARIASNDPDFFLLHDLFTTVNANVHIDPATTPFNLGSLYLSILASHNINLANYLLHELDFSPHLLPGFILPSTGANYDRKIIAGIDTDGNYVLGWRYATEHTLGSLVVGEFEDLGGWAFGEDEDGGGLRGKWRTFCHDEWPFAEEEERSYEEEVLVEEKRVRRFDRLMERKERKDRAREKKMEIQEREARRVRMPGSWIE